MPAIRVFPPAGAAGTIQIASSSGSLEASYAYFDSFGVVHFPSGASFGGTADFSGASVTGIAGGGGGAFDPEATYDFHNTVTFGNGLAYFDSSGQAFLNGGVYFSCGAVVDFSGAYVTGMGSGGGGGGGIGFDSSGALNVGATPVTFSAWGCPGVMFMQGWTSGFSSAYGVDDSNAGFLMNSGAGFVAFSGASGVFDSGSKLVIREGCVFSIFSSAGGGLSNPIPVWNSSTDTEKINALLNAFSCMGLVTLM